MKHYLVNSIYKIKLAGKIGLFSGFTMGSFFIFANQPSLAQSQSFSQCVMELYRGPYSRTDAAKNCLNAFRGRPVNEEFTNCVNTLYRGPYSRTDANNYCQQAFSNSSMQNSNPPSRTDRGGDPQAIADCMKKLMYDRRPVCTRGSCARLGSPADNANRGFGGWQWQTVRTDISEEGAAQTCQNARY